VKAKAAVPKRSAGVRTRQCAKSFGSASQQGKMQFFKVYFLSGESKISNASATF
jgi:hypothetical protein